MALDFSTVITERTRDFCGRAWLFAEIQAWLADSQASPYFILTGEPGIGKSAIAARVVQTMQPFANHFCLARRADSLDPLQFIRSLALQLSQQEGFALKLLQAQGHTVNVQINAETNLGEIVGVRIDELFIEAINPPQAFNQVILEPLQAYCATRPKTDPLLIVVDGLDEAETAGFSESIGSVLANAGGLPQQVRWLLTTRPEPAVLRLFEHLATPPRLLDAAGEQNLADAHRYLEARLPTLAQVQAWLMQARHSQAALVERLLKASQGNFLYLSQLLPALEADPTMLDAPGGLPAGLDGIYRQFLLTRTPGKRLTTWTEEYRPLMGFLAAAQAPFTMEQIMALTGWKRQMAGDRLRTITQFLEPVGAGQTPTYQLYHQSLADFLGDESRAGDLWIDMIEVHAQIAAYYLESCAANWAACDVYALRYLPVHLLRAGQTVKLKNLLLDFDWLQARLNDGGPLELLSVFDILPGDAELRLTQSAIRLSLNTLAIDPGQLYTQLYARTMTRKEPLLSRLASPPPGTWLRPLSLSFAQAGGELLRTITAHPEQVHAVALSADGQRAVSASHDKTLKIWDLERGLALHTLVGHGKHVDQVAITPQGTILSTSWDEKDLYIWDLESGALLKKLPSGLSDLGPLALSADGRWAASGNPYKSLVCLWNLETGKRRKHLRLGEQGWVMSLAFIPGKNWLAIGGRELITLWDLDSYAQLMEFDHHAFDTEITALAASPNGRFLASATGLSLYSGNTWIFPSSTSIRLWDLQERKMIHEFSGHGGAITSLAFTPDGKRLVSGAKSTPTPPLDDTVRLWELQSNAASRIFEGHTAAVNSVAVSPDGKWAISASDDATLRIWDLTQDTVQPQTRAHGGKVKACVCPPTSTIGLSAAEDGALMVWDLQNGSSLYRLQGELSIWTLGAAADGRWAVTCGDEYARVYSESIFSTDLLLWELEPGVRPITLKETRGGLIENRYTAAAILPDGKRALIARQDDEFPGKPASYQVWAFETHKKIQEWEIAGERIHCLLPLTEQSFLAGGQKLKLWDMSSKPPNARILLDEPVIALAISPDRNRWAAATGGKQVILWDTHLLQPLFSLDAQAVYANSLAFVLVGQGLAILHDDQALRIWDLETRQVKAIFYGESELTSLSAGLDGTSLLVGEKSGRVHILRLEN